jgi:GxxExxY protein
MARKNTEETEGTEATEDLISRVRTSYEAATPLPADFNELTGKVIGAAIEVHRNLGPGFFELIYEEALCVELGLRGIQFRRQVEVPIVYKAVEIGRPRLDLVVEDRVVVELKAVESVSPLHKAQLLSYLKAGGFKLGLLLNFNVRFLRDGVTRIIDT